MRELLENSLIIRWIKRIRVMLGEMWPSSMFYTLGRALGQWLRKGFGHSRLAAFFSRSGLSEPYFETSFFYLLFSGIFSKMLKGLRRLYLRRQEAFESSLVLRPFYILTNHMIRLSSFFLLMVFLIPHTLWNDQISLIAACLFLGLCLFKAVAEPLVKKKPRVLDLYFFIFLLSVILARVLSVFPNLSHRVFSFYITCFAFLFVQVSSIKSVKELAFHINLLIAGTTLSGMYGLWQSISGIPVIPYQMDIRLNEGMPGRVYSTFENSNNFAQILVMMLPFFMAALLNARSLKRKLLLSIALIPPVMALFLSLSRSGWIGFAVSLLCFFLLVRPSLLPLLAVPVLLVLPLMPDFILRRLSTITNPQDTSIDTRLNILKTMSPIVKDFWYTGTGLGSEVLTRLVRNYPIYTTTAPSHSHNLYLQILLETGIVGLLSFIGFLLRLIKKSLKALYSKENDQALRNFIIAGLSGLSGVLAIALIEYVWFYPRVMLIFWVVIGVILSALRLIAQAHDTCSQ